MRKMLTITVAVLALSATACGGPALNGNSQCFDWHDASGADAEAYAKGVAKQLQREAGAKVSASSVEDEIGSLCAAATASHLPQSLGGLHHILGPLMAGRREANDAARAKADEARATGEVPLCEDLDPAGATFTGAAADEALKAVPNGIACVTANGEKGVVFLDD